jgi:hypothetical protein
LQVVEVERAVLVDVDEADGEAEIVSDREPRRDVRVVVEPGYEDLVAGAKAVARERAREAVSGVSSRKRISRASPSSSTGPGTPAAAGRAGTGSAAPFTESRGWGKVAGPTTTFGVDTPWLPRYSSPDRKQRRPF